MILSFLMLPGNLARTQIIVRSFAKAIVTFLILLNLSDAYITFHENQIAQKNHLSIHVTAANSEKYLGNGKQTK